MSTVFETATNYYVNYKIAVFNTCISILKQYHLKLTIVFFKIFWVFLKFIVKKTHSGLYMVCMSESLFHVFIQSILHQDFYIWQWQPSHRQLTLSINTHTKQSLTVCLLSSVLIICRMCIVYSNSMYCSRRWISPVYCIGSKGRKDSTINWSSLRTA